MLCISKGDASQFITVDGNYAWLQRDGEVPLVAIPTACFDGLPTGIDETYGISCIDYNTVQYGDQYVLQGVRLNEDDGLYDILTDNFGIDSETVFDVMFLNNFVLLRLNTGHIYVNDYGTCYILSDNGTSEIYTGDMRGISWIDDAPTHLAQLVGGVIKSKYNLGNIVDYLCNAIFSVVAYTTYYVPAGDKEHKIVKKLSASMKNFEPIFNSRVLGVDTNISLGRIAYDEASREFTDNKSMEYLQRYEDREVEIENYSSEYEEGVEDEEDGYEYYDNDNDMYSDYEN